MFKLTILNYYLVFCGFFNFFDYTTPFLKLSSTYGDLWGFFSNKLKLNRFFNDLHFKSEVLYCKAAT